MRVAPLMLVVFTAGCLPPGGAATPEQAVREYFLARATEERLQFILDADAVRPLLPQRPGMLKFRFDQVNIQPPIRLGHAGEWYTIRAAASKGSESTETQFYVGRQTDGFKIDWKASAGYNPAALATVLATAADAPRRFRLKARLATYYYHDFWATEPQFQCVELTEEESHKSIYGFVRRNTDVGRRLQQLLADGSDHPVILELRRVGPRGDSIADPEAEVVTITDLVSDSWLE